ncbi:MAG: M3 family oligoendopeptidase [Saprospiraceae bacterium]|jgi:M3 family oligoendopeptidase
MKFEDFTYVRPVIASIEEQFNDCLNRFETATSLETQSEIIEEINIIRQRYSSMYNLCHIRHTIDIKDKFYEEENNFFDLNNPSISALTTRYYKLLLTSPFKIALEKKWGKQLFVISELSIKTFQPSILNDLKEENRLISEYVKIKAGAEIEFRGKKYTISALSPLETSSDRTTRKEAAEAKWGFYSKHSSDFEQIFDKQVKVRHKIAQELGYKNFIELGYARMLRSDYNAGMVSKFRKQVEEYIVPIASELYKRQSKRIGIENLRYYDEGFRFASGNPKPKGSPDWIVGNASKMYKELSEETGEFFDFMQFKNLMDLVNKEGKATGGYCTYIDEHKAPYIFSNFNGTSGDIDVLTHEAGHAFQVYSSRHLKIKEYNWPTYEACEIHSMSMEFFTWPWMNLFFKEDTEKYKFAHLSGAILFLPYGVAVDEFQHFVYEHPEATPAERNETWRKIEQKYLPHRNYEGNAFLEKGGFWQRQSHIFTTPFYYIDYTLAQICAFQFWVKDQDNHATAWKDYLALCKLGGSKSFLELVEVANLRSPFEENCVESIINVIKNWLDKVDDSKF